MLVITLLVWFKSIQKDYVKVHIYNLTKYWPGGSYLMLKSKSKVSVDRILISICCKYNE